MYSTNIVKEELIGRCVKIAESMDPTLKNICGTIIDETKNTIILETKDNEKIIAKNAVTFEFDYNGKKILIKGSRLMYRPEDRTKKAR